VSDPAPEPANRLPVRARALWILQYEAAALVAAVAVGGVIGWPWWIPVLVVAGIGAAVAAQLRYARWRYEVREEEIDLRHGVWTVTRTLVPIRRVQHVDTEAGPVQGAMDLRSVAFHTAAGKTQIPAVAPREAEAIRRRVAELARTRDDV
jgi:membrane protein YdbS with pleckstrin-like domain